VCVFQAVKMLRYLRHKLYGTYYMVGLRSQLVCGWFYCPLLNNVEIALLGVGPFLSFNHLASSPYNSFFPLEAMELQEYLDQIL